MGSGSITGDLNRSLSQASLKYNKYSQLLKCKARGKSYKIYSLKQQARITSQEDAHH